MKHRYLWLALALMGCGSEDDADATITDLPVTEQLITTEDGEEILAMVSEAPPLGYDPTDNDDPWIVAEVDVGETHIQFIEVTIADENGRPLKSALMNMSSPFGTPSPVDELRNSSSVPLTIAEIYAGLTGHQNTVPDALMRHHLREVEQFDRSEAMIQAVRVPLDIAATFPELSPDGRVLDVEEKQAQDVLSSKDMNVSGDSFYTPPVLNHQWVAVHMGDTHFCPSSGVCAENGTIRVRTVCTGRLWWDDIKTFTPTSTTCTRNLTGWIRTGAWNRPVCSTCTASFSQQQFYGPTVGSPWRSFPPSTVEPNVQHVADWNDPAQKRMAHTVSRQQKYVIARMVTAVNRAL